MAYDIGPKIGIDGEKEFRKNINDITQVMKTLGTEMKAVSSEFADNGNSQQALIAKNKVLNKQIEEQKKKLELLSDGLSESSEKYGENDKKTLQWKASVNTAQAELNRLENELKKNNSVLDDMDKGLRDTETGLKNIGEEAETAEEKTEGFGDTLKSAILGGAVVGAIQSITSSIKEFSEEMEEYRKIMASLEISSQKAGYTAEQTAGTYETLFGVLDDDQTAATTTANLQALRFEQQKLNEITNGVIGAWATYGDSIPIDGLAESVNETIKAGQVTGNFADVLNWAGTSEDEFNKKLEKASSEAERANIVLEEFARQGLIEAGEGWQKNNKSMVEVNKSSARVREEMARLSALFDPIISGMNNGTAAILGYVNELVDAFRSGGFTGIVETGGKIIQELIGGIQNSMPQITAVAGNIVNELIMPIINNLPNGLVKISEIIAGAFSEIAKGIPEAISGGLDFIQGFGDKLAEMAPILIQNGFSMVQNLVQGITEALPTMIEKIPQIVSTFANIINDNAPTVLISGGKLILQLLQGILKSIPTLVSNIPKIVDAIVDVVMAFQWLGLGKNIITLFKNGIMAAKGLVKTAADNIHNTVKSAVQNLPQTLANIGRTAISGLGNAISAAIGVVKSAAMNIANGIISTLTTIPGKMLSIGKNIVQGLWNGISNMTGWVISKIRGFGNSVLSGLKSFFGIHSPSTVMEKQVGRYLAEGIGVGFTKQMVSVSKDMKSALDIATMRNNNLTATAKSEITMRIDYDRLEKMQGKGIYLNGRLLGREMREMGVAFV